MDNKAKILDIAMNLNRIGNWAADDYDGKKIRIEQFLNQTTQYIDTLTPSSFSDSFKTTFDAFLKEYLELKKTPNDRLLWAEKLMTWGNILTHRSKLL
jgi:hypothetical protein